MRNQTGLQRTEHPIADTFGRELQISSYYATKNFTRSFHYCRRVSLVTLPNRVKNDVVFECEKPLRANEARLIDLARSQSLLSSAIAKPS
jgi:hypothetical protein